MRDRRNPRHRAASVIGLVSILIVGACAPTASPSAEPGSAEPGSAEPNGTTLESPSEAEQGPTGDVVVALSSFGSEQMDPSMGSTTDLLYNGPGYDWLIGATPEGEISNEFGVLDSWEPNAEATEWTFRLKEGIEWQDGEPMTSADVKFTLEHFGREEAVCTSCGALKAGLDNVEILDDTTVTIHLKSANVIFPVIFGPLEGDVRVLPKHYIDSVGIDAFREKPMGSGPWKFVKRTIGESIEYEANAAYWNPGRVPKFKNLRIIVAPEATTRTAMLRQDEADVIALEPQDVSPLRDDGFEIVSAKNVITSVIMLYKSYDPAFITNRIEFRKALAHGADWDTIVESFYPPEVGERHYGGAPLFSPVTAGFDSNLAGYEYDPELAKQFLAQSGYAGEKLTYWNFFFSTNPEQPEVNEVIAGYWRELGINIEIVNIDYGSFRPKQVADPQDFVPPGSVGVQTPSSRPSVLNNMRVFMISHEAGGSNWIYWQPDKIDGIYKDLTAVVDEADRNQRLLELNRELYEEYWAIPLVLRHLPYATGPRIAGWQPTNGTPADLAYETLSPADN